jgi:D-glycero-alpha-D-manno-heptose-7-phosphate kinase
MIITKTPFRISFFGGGTDYPDWVSKNGGKVLTTTIDKYCYISVRILPPFFKHKHRIVYSHIENVNNIKEIKHPSVREILNYFRVERGVEIHHDGDLPARSGLGSSSSFTVGLINALRALEGKVSSKKYLAETAIFIEQVMVKENVGSQDQVITAYGGFNSIEFLSAKKFDIQPIIIKQVDLENFKSHLLLFFTGQTRVASNIVQEQLSRHSENKKALLEIRDMVNEAEGILKKSKDFKMFGRLLDESWKLKKSLSKNISNKFIDDAYSMAKASGALGGKLLGAGGGGFLLVFAEPHSHSKIKKSLKNLLHIPFEFDSTGSQVMVNNYEAS